MLAATACVSARRAPSPERSPLAAPAASSSERSLVEPQQTLPLPPPSASTQQAELPDHLAVEQLAPVIAKAAPSVKKYCWQPALDGRAEDAPTSARILVHADIDPSGVVTRVEAEDGPAAYPNLSNCAAEVVRMQKFPKARTTTRVNIPFVFDARNPDSR
jgi:hypothetical protein